MARWRSGIVVAVLACLLLGWWLSRPSGRLPPAPAPGSAPIATTHATASRCTLPPTVVPGDAPLQTDVPNGMQLPMVADARLTPLAGFSVDARVLGREDYASGREAHYSPTDLALGWGRMADDAVLSRLQIRQGGRWYRYSWQGEPPIPVAEIVRSSANMHMVPADDAVAAALKRLEAGERVRIDGWLVQVDGGDWRWRSSLTRDDSGAGACEVVYACAVTRE